MEKKIQGKRSTLGPKIDHNQNSATVNNHQNLCYTKMHIS